MTISHDKIANVYGIKSKTIYPYGYIKDENFYNKILGNLSIEYFRSLLTNKFPLHAEVDEFIRSNSKKTVKN